MMGERRMIQEALFYGFSLERYVPDNHMLRRIDPFRRPCPEFGRISSPITATSGGPRSISN
jgi:hypothetical protein